MGGAESTRRSGPGDGARRSSRQPLGFVTLEVDKLVNPRKHTLVKMIEKRCPSLMLHKPCGPKGYCQVQVRFSDQAAVDCIIRAIAQDKMITGLRIREKDWSFESLR